MKPWVYVERIPDEQGAPYLVRRRAKLPFNLGFVCVHTFFGPDPNPSPHDHPWDFTTFPLKTYLEEVWDIEADTRTLEIVRGWRPHRRQAERVHKVLGPTGERWPLTTLVWLGPFRRQWGFWTDWADLMPLWKSSRKRTWMPQAKYLQDRKSYLQRRQP